MKEVSTFLCYEATANLKLKPCEVKTRVAGEAGQCLAERVGVVPVLRGGLGMVDAMTEMVSNAQVWHHELIERGCDKPSIQKLFLLSEMNAARFE